MKFVVISRGRADSIANKTIRLIPDAVVCVSESERSEYQTALPGCSVVTHPDSVVGIGPIRNWVIKNLSDGCCVILDDDISCVYDQSNVKKIRIEDPGHCMAILERTAIAAKDAGVRLFGFTQMARPLAYRPFQPIALSTWVGGVVGVIGTEPLWDENLLLRADIDACLKSLMRDRIVWVDSRYCWIHIRFEGKGGNNTLRSEDRHNAEIEKLRARWGRYLAVKKEQGTIRLVIRVAR